MKSIECPKCGERLFIDHIYHHYNNYIILLECVEGCGETWEVQIPADKMKYYHTDEDIYYVIATFNYPLKRSEYV